MLFSSLLRKIRKSRVFIIKLTHPFPTAKRLSLWRQTPSLYWRFSFFYCFHCHRDTTSAKLSQVSPLISSLVVVVALVLYCSFALEFLDLLPTMLKRRGKIIEVESDEEIDSYPYLLKETPLNPQISPSDVGPSQSKETLRFPSLVGTPPLSGHEYSGDDGGRASGSYKSRGFGEGTRRKVAPN